MFHNLFDVSGHKFLQSFTVLEARLPQVMLKFFRHALAYASKRVCVHRVAGIDLEHVMVTVMDADAQVPELYVREVDSAISRVEDPYTTIFAGPVMFERNTYDVPVFTRIHDFMWSGEHAPSAVDIAYLGAVAEIRLLCLDLLLF